MTTATAPVQPFAIKSRTVRDKSRLVANNILSIICILLSFLTLVPLFSIIYLVVQNGLPLLRPSVFTDLPPAPGVEGGGFGNAIQGTLLMVLIALAIAVPLGILSAVYICEYNRKARLAGAVRFVAKLLTGIPSIICGCLLYTSPSPRD